VKLRVCGLLGVLILKAGKSGLKVAARHTNTYFITYFSSLLLTAFNVSKNQFYCLKKIKYKIL